MEFDAPGEYRDDAEAWYEVVAESGVELVEAPDTTRGRMLELFLPGKVRLVMAINIGVGVAVVVSIIQILHFSLLCITLKY